VHFSWRVVVLTLLGLLAANLPADAQLFRGRLAPRRSAPCVPLPVYPPPYALPAAPPAPTMPQPVPPEVKKSDPLEPPAGNVLLFSYRASGVQIYRCQAKKGSDTEFEWVLSGPDAILYDARDEEVGTHFAGPT
jgi:hypothetical protein